MMSNITVCVRFRPLSPKEKEADGGAICVQGLDSETFFLKVPLPPYICNFMIEIFSCQPDLSARLRKKKSSRFASTRCFIRTQNKKMCSNISPCLSFKVETFYGYHMFHLRPNTRRTSFFLVSAMPLHHHGINFQMQSSLFPL